jgi:hypothetical protein
VSVENLQITLDADEEREHYFRETSTVIFGGALPSVGIFGMPRWPSAFVPVTAAVTIEGTVFVFTEPTPQWLTIYPSIQPGSYLDVLEDLDIPFKPKKTRMAKGIVLRRSKARFKTAFADDLIDEMNISK